ncbi:AbiH family protein [Lysinibacillus sphaericus]|uniref:AbiH family protein n=1 Tax=Lysinibacillus sphaericus TaxID=1421 RepID=UPI0037FCE8BC
MKIDLYKSLEKYILEEDLWNNLEDALGNLDYDQLEQDSSIFYLGYGDENWRDSANHDYQNMIEDSLSFTENLKKEFNKWIIDLDINITKLDSLSGIIRSNNVYINFNYTDTLERVYSIPENRVTYIHCKANRGEELILGHHDSSYWNKNDVSKMNDSEYAAYMEYQSERDFRDIEAKQIIAAYFKRTYKDTKEIIEIHKNLFLSLKNAKNIYVLGHSLSEIDFDYFKEIRKNVPDNCNWYISYYSSEDYKKALKLIKILDIYNYNFFEI